MSNFAFLSSEFPAVHEAAAEAERQAAVSPTAAAFFAGKAVEVAVKWAFRTDPGLNLPYQDNISALLHEPSFRKAAGEAVFAKARYINTLRNRAVHEEKTISSGDANGAVKELFHVCFWFARTYSNFADEIGDGVEHVLPQVGEADFARFKQKARHFLKAHEDHIVLHKLRQGKPLTPTDLSELEKMLLDAGIGEAGDIERARETSKGFGRFVRSMVGLDRAAVREAFREFLAAGIATAAQIEFINMVIEHLTDQGVMEPELLYEPPFTDVAPTGPEKLFDEEKVTRLFTKIQAINDSAVA
jgi:type I site-specific restriction endonuclease